MNDIYKPNRNRFNMGGKVLLVFLISLLVISMVVAAEQQSLGTFKQNECINLIQTCANCSYVNISSVITSSSVQVLGQSEMTKVGTIYNITFCGTSLIGKYVVNGVGDLDGTNQIWSYDFEITPSGFTGTLGFYAILLVILGGVITLGFAIKEGWFVVIGGMGLMILGLYSVINGIAGFKDMFITWTISIFLLSIGAYLSIKSAIELIEEVSLT